MVTRDKIVNFINVYLNSGAVGDASQNGLQVEGRGEVKKIVFGVSANMELFKKADQAGADMIITHHGLLWSQNPALTGLFKKRVEFLLKRDISLAAWHLPLDKHAVVGNNAQILRALGVKKVTPFGLYHGVEIGFKGALSAPQTLPWVQSRLGFGAKEIFAFGKKKVKTVAVVSGGGHGMFESACKEEIDLFITGSTEEYVQEIARECKINYIGVGHYNSETFGVKALMDIVSSKFGVKVEFIDIANPL